MQDTTATHNVLVVPALEAGLMTAPEDRALGRGDVDPILTQDANGVYLLSLCNQGTIASSQSPMWAGQYRAPRIE